MGKNNLLIVLCVCLYLLTGSIPLFTGPAFAQDYNDSNSLTTSGGSKVIVINNGTKKTESIEIIEDRNPKSMTWTASFDELFSAFHSVQEFGNRAQNEENDSSILGGNAVMNKIQHVKNLTNQLSNLQSNRIIHTAVTISKHEKVVKGFKGMIKKKNKLHLIYYQIAIMLGLVLIKNWQLSKLEKGEFTKRCFIELQSTLFLFAGLTIAAPLLFYGHDYANVLKGLVEVIRSA